MATLSKDKQEKIDEIRFGADEYFMNERSKYYELKEKAWSLYPEPKNEWNEAYSLAKDFFSSYLFENKNNKAKEWLDKMIENNNNLHLFDFDIDFEIGKYFFETKNYTKTLEKWKFVVKETGYRYFEDEDPKYKDFYLNPEKYIKE